MTALYLSLSLLLISAVSARADRYVWINSPHPSAPYDSWTNAAHDVQTAVNMAADETVWVTNGVYTVTNEIGVGSGITLRSVNSPAATILLGGYPAFTNRIITLSGGVVHGFTITNGYINSGGGGGVYMDSPGGTVSNCIITGNCVASSDLYGGGGVYMKNAGNGLVQDCEIVANRSVGISGKTMGGGGIMTYSSYPSTIRNCLIADNISDNQAGGVFLYNSALMEDCVISNNVADTRGGGVYFNYYSEARGCNIVDNFVTGPNGAYGGGVFFHNNGFMSNCTIRCNSSEDPSYKANGGGVYIQYAGEIFDSVISENNARRGGGVYFYGKANDYTGGFISGCLISGNSALSGGGGLAFTLGKDGGGLAENCTIVSNTTTAGIGGGVNFISGGRIRNCLVAANQASGFGGGIMNSSTGGGYAESCTIVRNSSGSEGGGVYMERGSITNCIVWYNGSTKYNPQYKNLYFLDNSGSGYSCSPDLTEGSAGNITGAPNFKQAGTGAGVGATLGDYRLNGGSPCIDTGINLPWMIGASDLDGGMRVYPAAGKVDMGAYENITLRGTLLLVN